MGKTYRLMNKKSDKKSDKRVTKRVTKRYIQLKEVKEKQWFGHGSNLKGYDRRLKREISSINVKVDDTVLSFDLPSDVRF